MNQAVLVALIGAGGIVIGAVLSFLASALGAQQKIRELEVSYMQKSQENHLINARQYMNTVYLPINIQLSKLENHYYTFKTCMDICDEDADDFKQALKDFRQACDNFNEEISKLINQGEDAYLTSKVETVLRSFNNFIQSSKNAKKHSLSLVGKVRLRFLGFENGAETSQEGVLERDVEAKLLTVIQNMKPLTRLMNSVAFYMMFFEINIVILAAPINSLAFERRMYTDIPMIKAFIKEVTLGTTPTNAI